MALLFAIAALAVLYYAVTRPPGPTEIKIQTLQALERKDTDALCRLADETELTTLGLNPSNVRAFLYETVWGDGPMRLSEEKRYEGRDDEALWKYTTRIRGNKAYVVVQVLDDRKKGWNLVLSTILRSAAYTAPLPGKNGEESFRTLAQKHSIAGHLNGLGEFVLLKATSGP